MDAPVYGFWDRVEVQAGLLPVMAAFLACGVIRLAGGAHDPHAPHFRGWGPTLASAGLPIGFTAALLAIIGPPPFPPIQAADKLPYIAVAALLAGTAVDTAGLPPRLAPRLAMLIPPLAILTVALPRFGRGDVAEFFAIIVACVLSGAAGRQMGTANPSGVVRPVVIMAAAFATSAVAWHGSSFLIAAAAAAVGAAQLGLLLWCWPEPRFRTGDAALLPSLAVLAALIAMAGLYASASPAALMLLFPIFFAERVLDRFRLAPQAGGRPVDNLAGPWVLLAAAAVPALIAVAVARRLASGPPLYG